MAQEFVQCEVDDDCRIAEVCISANASWNQFGQPFCLCNPYYGWVGEDCFDFSGRSIGIIVSTFFQIAVLMYMSVVLLRDSAIVAYAVRRNKQIKFSLKLTLASTCAGVLSLLTWRVLFLIATMSPSLNDRVPIGNTVTENSLSSFMRPFVVLSSCFVFIATVTISVLWVELAQATNKLKVRLVKDETKYKKIVWTTQIFFAIVMTSCIAAGRFDIGPTAVAPFLVGVNVVIFIGRHRMSKLLKEALSSHENSSRAATGGATTNNSAYFSGSSGAKREFKDARYRTRRALQVINRTALHVIVGYSIIIIGGAAYSFANNAPAASWQEFQDPNAFGFNLAAGTLVTYGLLYTFIAITVYIHRNIRKVVKPIMAEIASTQYNDAETVESKVGPTATYASALGGASAFDDNSTFRSELEARRSKDKEEEQFGDIPPPPPPLESHQRGISRPGFSIKPEYRSRITDTQRALRDDDDSLSV
mmetsp:Transcript_6545/g.12068  ORF Transcript_6545/g.12068 Transcript_6545/m.12068 type:complete len:476 (-) Transcript_6545:62-1489(-)